MPASFANRPISLRIYPDRQIVAAEGNVLGEHGHVIQRRAMRHDLAGAAIAMMLGSPKMPGMAHPLQDLLGQGSPAFEAAMPILLQLLKAAMAER